MSLEGKAAADKLLRGKINGLDVIYTDTYEIAVANGYKGTVEEWLAQLPTRAEVDEAVEQTGNYCKSAEDYCKQTAADSAVAVDAKSAALTAAEKAETKVESLLERNNKLPVSLWVGTQAEYDAITDKDESRLYIISDDQTLEDIEDELKAYVDDKDTNISGRLWNVETGLNATTEKVNNATSFLRIIDSSNAIAYGGTADITNAEHAAALATRKMALVRVAGQSVLCSVATATDYTSNGEDNMIYISGSAPYSRNTDTSSRTIQLIAVDIRIAVNDIKNPTAGVIANWSIIQNIGGGNVVGANSNVVGATVYNILLLNATDFTY